MSSRVDTDVTPAQRAAPSSSKGSRALGGLCFVAIASFSSVLTAQTDPSPAAAATAIHAFPKRLLITVVSDERQLGTFQQRVSSWFDDGTEVRVAVASDADAQRLLASSPTEVRAWIVPLSAERALLTFSSVTPPAPPRYLVREVPLRAGFDELGLERLASVTHSGFVALSEGVDGVERTQAERELGAAGVAAGSRAPSPEPAPSQPTPSPPPLPLPTPHVPARNRSEPPAPEQSALLFAAGYGVRLRGAEGIGHGPSLMLGVQLASARTAFDLQLSGQYLFRSEFEAKPFAASVQITALRVQLGIEPRHPSSFFAHASLGLGADLAKISASSADSNADSAQLVAYPNGTQWRGVAELALGIVRHGEILDVGLYAQTLFSFEDIRYNAATSAGETLLVRPWLVQPALSIQGRFRSAW